MSWIQVETEGGASSFRPGEAIGGTVRWQLEEAPEEVEVRLLWYTEGKGDGDLEVVQSMAFTSPGKDDRRSFRFRAPEGPFSFSGKLISLVWAVEAVAQPGDWSGRTLIAVSPTGEEILLYGHKVPPSA